MKRRDFAKLGLLAGVGSITGANTATAGDKVGKGHYLEPARKLPVRDFDVVVAGGGTAGVVAALAAARTGAETALIETKGYTGGTVTEGGTAIHSYYNLWKAFPGVEKRQVVKGIPLELIDRMIEVGGCTGHAEMERGYDYDSVCTALDVELYKLVTMRLLAEAGVFMALCTTAVGTVMDGKAVKGVIVESRSGREVFQGKSFVDCTAYGDLAAHAGAEYTVPEDYNCCNSIGLGNVDMDQYYAFLKKHDAVGQLARGLRSGVDDQLVRLQGRNVNLPEAYTRQARAIGMSGTTTTTHDNYIMFVKFNYRVPGSVMNRDDMSKAELVVREHQYRGLQLVREYIPGCKTAFIARTAPRLNIRRGRLIKCDYDITHEDVIEARHFDDEVFVYGFHDSAPRLQIKDGGTYGIPYRALCVKGVENLYVSGMMLTKDHRAHMSTRNTVSSMAQGQATGTAAAMCARKEIGSRDLKYHALREQLERDNVNFEW
ncbi:MAG: FAD-dependent oxidoreductase [Puniceicoccaceae bacterium]